MSTAAAQLIENDMPILGVEIKELKTHNDQRGFFREVIRVNDPIFRSPQIPTCPFGQWSHSRMEKNVVKAWHYHHVQIDWWYVAIGALEVVLFDNRVESPTHKNKMLFLAGEGVFAGKEAQAVCVKIPPGVLHGCKVLSSEAHLFYITSTTYDPNEEGRFPYDSPIVGHDWGADAIVADNDRRAFEPTATRAFLALK